MLKFKTLSYLFIFSLIFILSGCEKELNDSDTNTKINIPSDFDYSLTKDIDITVKVNDKYDGQYYYTVEIFDSNPIINHDANLLSKGSANQKQDYEATVTVLKTLNYIYIRQTSPTSPTKLSVVKIKKISGDNISVDFVGTVTSVKSLTKSSAFTTKTNKGSSDIDDSDITKEYSTPDISELTQITASSKSSITLETGKKYIIPAEETYSGKITFPYTDSYLYIEGTWNNTSSSVSTNGWKVIVQNGGKITSTAKTTLKINSSSILFTADGGIIDGNNISVTQNNESGSKIVNLGEMGYSDMNDIIGLYNYGTLTISDYLTTNSSNAKIFNEGTLTINNDTNNKTSMQGTFQNSGIVTITGDLTSNTSDFLLINNGPFEIKQLKIKGTIQNNCKFIVDDTAKLNSSSTLNISSKCIFKAATMDIAGTTINLESDAILEVNYLNFINSGASYIYGSSTGNYALARLYKIELGDWSKPTFDGNLEIESSDYPTNENETSYNCEDNVNFVEEGESDLTIASTECNIDGNIPEGGDSPKDIPFPIIESSTNVYTYLFEDCWPNLRDYDMNDIVMDIKNISYSKNSENYIESMTITAVLRADGGVYKLGGAIQLDGIESENINSILGESEDNLTGEVFNINTKNGTEKGQTYAVIPLFDEAHAALGASVTMTNTIKDGGNTPTSKTISLTINFKENTKLSSSDLSMNKLNVFIIGHDNKMEYNDITINNDINCADGKRREIHLAGYAPTNLGTKSLFGTGDDNSSTSNVSSLYKSNTNLIWGLAVPGPLSYPSEKIKITTAYPDFEDWTTSGGTTNNDWYNNHSSGYIYQED